MPLRPLLAVLILLAATAVPMRTSWADDLWDRDTLTGDWGGWRPSPEKQHLAIGLSYTGEAFDVASHGTVYQDRFLLTGDVDLGHELTAHVAGLTTNGRGPGILAGNLLGISNIEAAHQTRLWEAWAQYVWVPASLSLRAGQISLDDEFLTSPTAGNLINPSFGWPALAALDLPGGGPAYPVGAPGLRVQWQATHELTAQATVTSAIPEDPTGSGANFRIDGGALAIAELQWSDPETALPGAYKLGGWYDSGRVPDQRVDATGGFQGVSGLGPRQDRGDWSLYAVADQGLAPAWNIFLRGGVAPGDRNLISAYVDGGVGWTGPLPGREADVLTLGVAVASAGAGARGFDADSAAPVRGREVVWELDYMAQLAPWWSVQPDLQYVLNPGAVSAPAATVLGLRTVVTF